MDQNKLLGTVKKVRELSQKRNFKQTFDLIINLKDIDLKKADQQIEFFIPLHYSKGKKVKVCALVGPELASQAKEVFDLAINVDDFDSYVKDKKLTKNLANDYDFFVAQATIMAKVASTFGRIFGPKGKMPNPKAGCVVPPNANLKPLYDQLQKTVKVSAKLKPLIQLPVGSEDMPDTEIADNILTLYTQLIHHLPNESHNIRSVYLKLTMGKPIKLKQDGSPLIKEEAPESPEEKPTKKSESK
jgi:large subunit ribosomal protein L1